jgi:nucleotide-binding universal stress UspA family protein
MKLLIGYDGSECADAALDNLNRAGLPRDVEAQILCIAEVWLPPPSQPGHEQSAESLYQEPTYARSAKVLREAESLAERARRRLAASFPGWKISASAVSGSPAWEMVFLADQWEPDLILVGSHGRSGFGRLVLGSVSQRVLAEARCSVRIARGRTAEPNTPIRIILGVDGSPGSEVAAKEVARREWPADSELRVVIVDDPLVPSFLGNLIAPLSETLDEANKEERSWAEKVLMSYIALLDRPGIKVTSEIKEGNPKHQLPQMAREWGADCIFVGSTGFSNRLERFVLGSVSAAVAARAHCSVEVIRARNQK